MHRRSKVTLACVVALAASFSLNQFSNAQDAMEAMYQQRGDSYSPISAEEVKTQATVELDNAKLAGRITAQSADEFGKQLASASSVDEVEDVWAKFEAKAQEAKNRHAVIETLLREFNLYIDQLEKDKIVSKEAMKVYRDRAAAIERLRKRFWENDKFYDFWEYIVLSLDLSALQERLSRAVTQNHQYEESLNNLIVRTDNYLLRNEVAARGLTTYKSYEVEPSEILGARNEFYAILKNVAHSNLNTPKVKEMVYARLHRLHTEPWKGYPSENDIAKAIVEVERLLESGAKNGHLSATDDVRLRHELELVKEIKKAYPGDKPGLDPVERELRNEEVRQMCQHLRFLQNWLGRVLRKDGDNDLGRESVTRLVHRIELAYTTHRITKQDVSELLTTLNTCLRDSDSEKDIAKKCKEIQGRMDMMVADFSMTPAQVAIRLQEVSRLISLLSNQSGAAAERDRLSRLASKVDQSTGADRYGTSIVAAAEIEMLRARVNAMLRRQGAVL